MVVGINHDQRLRRAEAASFTVSLKLCDDLLMSRSEPPLVLLERFSGRLGNWLGALPYPRFVALVTIVALARCGVAATGPNFVDPLREAAAAFPRPVSWISSSLGPVWTMRLVVGRPDPVWWTIGLVIFLLTLVFLFGRCLRAGPWARVAVLLVVLSTPFATSANLVGHYDAFVVAGSLAVVLSRSPVVAPVGAVLCTLGNPELALAAMVCLGLVAVALADRALIVRAAVAGAVVVLGYALVSWWLSSWPPIVDRTSFLTDPIPVLQISGRRWLADWPLATYAFLGPLWLVVLLALSRLSGWRLLSAATGTVLLPAAASIYALDGTRDFAVVGLAALVALLTVVWRREWSDRPPSPRTLGALGLGLVLLPAVVVLPDQTTYLRMPYDEILAWLGWSRI